MKKLLIFLLLIVVAVLGVFLYHKLTYKPVSGSWSLYDIEGVNRNIAIENGDLVNIEFLSNGKARITTLITGARDMDHDQNRREIKGDFGFLGTVVGLTGLDVNSVATYEINDKELTLKISSATLRFKLVENGSAPTPSGKWKLTGINGASDDVNSKIAADGTVQVEFVDSKKVVFTHGDNTYGGFEYNSVTSKLTGNFANFGFDIVNTYGGQFDNTAKEAVCMYDRDGGVVAIQIGDQTLIFKQK